MEKAKGKKLFYRPAGKRKGMYTPTQIICVSFVIVIALGTFLLSLPVASKHGRLDVLNAMFTATSATCVTGLIVRDTWTQFTYFGQAVILLLIQVGGLGLVTLTSFFALAMRRRMGFRDLRLLGESVSADGYAQAKDVLKIVVGLAGLFEGIGIVLLLIFFLSPHPWCSAILMALCTAGLFAVSSPEQVLIIRVAPGGEMLGGACVQMAFNLGNAIGAYVGGLALGGGYRYPALAGVPFALTGFILFVVFYKKFQSRY